MAAVTGQCDEDDEDDLEIKNDLMRKIMMHVRL